MRKKLKCKNNERMQFIAEFKRYGSKTNWHGFPERTILLIDIKTVLLNKIIADHIWFSCTKGFEALGELQDGDKITFFARVKTYSKGYVNPREGVYEKEIDYKLNNPTKLQVMV